MSTARRVLEKVQRSGWTRGSYDRWLPYRSKVAFLGISKRIRKMALEASNANDMHKAKRAAMLQGVLDSIGEYIERSEDRCEDDYRTFTEAELIAIVTQVERLDKLVSGKRGAPAPVEHN